MAAAFDEAVRESCIAGFEFSQGCHTISDLSTTNASLRNRFSRASSISPFSRLYSDLSTQLSSAITTSETNAGACRSQRTHQFDRCGNLHWVVVGQKADENVRVEADHMDSAAPLAIASSISSIVAAVFLLPLNSPFNS